MRIVWEKIIFLNGVLLIIFAAQKKSGAAAPLFCLVKAYCGATIFAPLFGLSTD